MHALASHSPRLTCSTLLQFGEVSLVIYPLPNAMFRIQILTKRPIPILGPLFDGAAVHAGVLGKLVRATAVNASKTIRAMEKFYKVTPRARMHAWMCLSG